MVSLHYRRWACGGTGASYRLQWTSTPCYLYVYTADGADDRIVQASSPGRRYGRRHLAINRADFFQCVHSYTEDDHEAICDRTEELSKLSGSALGAWLSNVLVNGEKAP